MSECFADVIAHEVVSCRQQSLWFDQTCTYTRARRNDSVAYSDVVTVTISRQHCCLDSSGRVLDLGLDPATLKSTSTPLIWFPLCDCFGGVGQVELELEGGRAFGTGEHPTTSMYVCVRRVVTKTKTTVWRACGLLMHCCLSSDSRASLLMCTQSIFEAVSTKLG